MGEDRAITDPACGTDAAQDIDLRVHGPEDPSGITRGPAFTFRFDGTDVPAHPGESIAAALLASGMRQLRTTHRQGGGEGGDEGRPRGLFCAIGTCFDCLVAVDGGRPVRACLTEAEPDIDVRPGSDVDLARGNQADEGRPAASGEARDER